jgi:endonuclease YncB( thermonuclease family)
MTNSTCFLCGLPLREGESVSHRLVNGGHRPVHDSCFKDYRIIELEAENEALKEANKNLMSKLYS